MANPAHNLGKVFISYSHRDKQWLERLRIHLRPLERESVFDVWDDTRIAAGQNWRNEIQRAVQAARVAVLLVSKDFLASDFIVENELPPLLQAASSKGLTVLPVILSPCRFEQTKSLFELQAVNSPSRTLAEMTEAEQDRVFVELSDQIHAALSKAVIELRNRLQNGFREFDREAEKESRKLDSDPSLKDRDKQFLLAMIQSTFIGRKKTLIWDELQKLNKIRLDEARKCDQQGATALPPDANCDDQQREVLEEEERALDLKDEEAIRTMRALTAGPIRLDG